MLRNYKNYMVLEVLKVYENGIFWHLGNWMQHALACQVTICMWQDMFMYTYTIFFFKSKQELLRNYKNYMAWEVLKVYENGIFGT